MNPDLDQFIATLPTQAVIFIAILARVAAMFVAFPAFMFQSTPMTVRAAMAIGVSLLLFPLVQPQFASAISDDVMVPARLLALLCSDFLSGALIGWLAQLMMLSFPISIQIMSTFIGISNVLQPDPELGAQSTPLSHLAQLSITLIVFSSSLYIFPLNALVGSYQVFPPGHFPFLGDAANSVAKATEYSFFLAFQLAMPVVLIGTIWPIMLGLLSRFSPGLQVYNLAMPAQLLGGIFLLALLLKSMLSVWTHAASAGLVLLPGYGLVH
ncbi:flagellar biosynthetic protein fliR [Acetobacter aceti NRIC 0242]|uniref:Flagellar biosynthetic protein FliR n=1 Tax=Acetobacter aceti NBRC 14818 TaxID=887700 RepID=A0AB33IE20_ACEAC|nr:flagellar biosynthetic protein FliR [Acetobacter aceti]TCS34186.1 flagellar biosynthetic protein FliR [Acetobacter aceti NBRC 14818]BCK75528.1 flagellar biosynthetic protein FliR [Acetobacter aceti NBRC 14818]GAN56709.1 flagellar biosynthetic protein FliR [Acetobacter aceti NBRC 14818]GBO79777.1 flagellar biosynthetic protein fliR [Acetobacter aceti NRIC 0242]